VRALRWYGNIFLIRSVYTCRKPQTYCFSHLRQYFLRH